MYKILNVSIFFEINPFECNFNDYECGCDEWFAFKKIVNSLPIEFLMDLFGISNRFENFSLHKLISFGNFQSYFEVT